MEEELTAPDTSNEVSSPPHATRSSNKPSYVIAAVLVAVLLVGGIVIRGTNALSHHTQSITAISPTEIPIEHHITTIAPSETASWSAYTTKDISFKYAPDSTVTNNLSYQLVDYGNTYGFMIDPKVENAAVPDWYQAKLFVYKNASYTDTLSYVKSIRDYESGTLKRYTNGVIDGYSFVIKQNSYPTLTVVEVKNHMLYAFQVTGTGGDMLSPYSQNMLDKIISTVHLTGDTSPDPKITDLIHFTTPAGWTQKITDTDISGFPGTIVITSPDMAPGAAGGPQTNAISMSFSTNLNGKTETPDSTYQGIYDEIHDLHPASAVSHDLIRTTIDGYPTISSRYDFEGHEHTYLTFTGEHMWTITIGAPSDTQETQHNAEVQGVISSIHFLTK